MSLERASAASTSSSRSFARTPKGFTSSIGGRFKAGTEDEIAIQEEVNTWKGVNRIVCHAFEFAQAHAKTSVCMADKSNAMTARARAVAASVQGRVLGVSGHHGHALLHRCLAMYLVLDPGQFQVIVTNNLFGDIVTDLAATSRAGWEWRRPATSIPAAPRCSSPSMVRRRTSREKTSPTRSARFSSAALMLETLGLEGRGSGDRCGGADGGTKNQMTPDIGGRLGTREAGDFIALSSGGHEQKRLRPEGEERATALSRREREGASGWRSGVGPERLEMVGPREH